ncbi:hypothetical protein HF526_20540 [Pseudonocardia sp. K10HN5]|uniref:Phenolic acid decarboxylase subunit D n=1 Tax=Pseudonocardia acidicola TaxID=2724939 RepID=A0ABX1SDP1_9PSEU|nr:non-oxidative hydroxyarylic acid decarboxylases subunit D [Pseudonocardia acidicola]NMH99685.1 hypothetical protein [Pseudonocardia acidicola]
MPGTCPRCDAHEIRVLTTSPVPGVWTMFSCTTCLYSWRSTEPSYATDPTTYPAVFKVDPATIPDMPVVPTVPQRRA